MNKATTLSRNSPLLRTRLLEGTFPISEAVELFDALGTLDERNDRRRKLYNGRIVPFVPFTKLVDGKIAGTHNQ